MGQKAPFSGQLLSDGAVAKLLSDMQSEVRSLESKIQYLIDVHKMDLAALDEACSIRVETEVNKVNSCLNSYNDAKEIHRKAIQRLNKQLDSKNKIRWYRNPYFYFTVVALVSLTGGVAIIVTSLR